MKGRLVTATFVIVTLIAVLLIQNPAKADDNPNILQTSTSPTEEWPMFHNDPKRSGYSISNAPNKNTTLWIFEAQSEFGRLSPVVAYGMVYIRNDRFHSLQRLFHRRTGVDKLVNKRRFITA